MKNGIFLALMVFACLLLVASCEKQRSERNLKATPLLKEKIGESTLDSIGYAESVEVEDLEPSRERGYAFTGSGQPLSQQTASELKKLILDDNSFEFTRMKSCLFVPKTAFHFKSKNKAPITVLYSPWCKQLKVIFQDDDAILEADAIAPALEVLLQQEGDK